MQQIIVAGLERSDRQQLSDLIESVGLEVQAAPTLKQLHEAFEASACRLMFLDTALDGSGGVDLLATLPLAEDQHIVLILRGGAEDALAQSIRADNVSTIGLPFDRTAVLGLLDRHAGDAQQGPQADDASETFESMLGNCAQMREVYEMIAKVAPTDASVLICGESGTGKELVSSAIHQRSKRSKHRFVAINCGAIAENLIESELFGHEKGAFTGAEKAHAGVFEQADGGTLFLDEVTEMPEPMQVRLLRVLENGTVRRVGSEKEIHVDVRVIAATNRDPQKAINEGCFREDVMYRLAVFPLTLPKLCDRGSDIQMLANHFLSQHNRENKTSKRFSQKAIDRMMRYDWPGNVRQLRNIVHRAYILESAVVDMVCLDDLLVGVGAGSCEQAVNGDHAEADRLKQASAESDRQDRLDAVEHSGDGEASIVAVEVGSSIDEAEQALILKTLEDMDGDKKRAAKVLGISLKTLYNRLHEYDEQGSENGQSASDEDQGKGQPESAEQVRVAAE